MAELVLKTADPVRKPAPWIRRRTMAVPKDPFMLLSWANMKLRDMYPSLEELAAAESADLAEITEKLEAAGYFYDSKKNQFVIRG